MREHYNSEVSLYCAMNDIPLLDAVDGTHYKSRSRKGTCSEVQSGLAIDIALCNLSRSRFVLRGCLVSVR